MNNNDTNNVTFTDEQKAVFSRRLREELEAAGHDAARIPASPTEKAIQAHEKNDLEALKDPKVRAEYLRKYGVDEFGRLHLRATRERRERERRAEEARLLEQSKARRGRKI